MINAYHIGYVAQITNAHVKNIYRIVDGTDPSCGNLLALVCIFDSVVGAKKRQEFIITDGSKCCRLSKDIQKCNEYCKFPEQYCTPQIRKNTKIPVKWRPAKYSSKSGLAGTRDFMVGSRQCDYIQLRYNYSFEYHPPYEFAGVAMSEEEMDTIRKSIVEGTKS